MDELRVVVVFLVAFAAFTTAFSLELAREREVIDIDYASINPAGLEVEQRRPNLALSSGVVVFDLSHQNAVDVTLFSTLSEFVTDGGGTARIYTGRGARDRSEPVDHNESSEPGFSEPLFAQSEKLSDVLKDAKAFVVISPHAFYEKEDLDTLRSFVNRGGKLLVVTDTDDPIFLDETEAQTSQFGATNSLTLPFGIGVDIGYLYNQQKNDVNFRNIVLKKFGASNVTAGLKEVRFYSACSITPKQHAIVSTSSDTYSSSSETQDTYAVASLKANVLVVCDSTFMSKPFVSVADNSQFVANIVAWMLE